MPQQQNQQQQGDRLVWFLGVVTLVLRIVLWPLRVVVARILFPPHERVDGLSPSVTKHAVQSFWQELHQLCPEFVVNEAYCCQSGFAAVREERTSEAQERMILVYLHSPLHPHKDDVRQRLLLSHSMRQYLEQHAAHLQVFGCSIHTAQGAHLAQSLHAASFPLVALLQQQQSSSSSSAPLQLVFCAQGPALCNMTISQFQNHLNTAVHRQVLVAQQAQARRLQREAEIQLRQEQDAEYQETLRQDQERQVALQQEQELRAELQRVEQQEKERAQLEQETKLEQARSLVKDEPVSGGTRVRFVLPTGTKIDRTFASTQTIQALWAYLTLYFHENPTIAIENIGLSTNYPKKSLNPEDDKDLTLEEAGISPQAVIMVQDLDA